MLDKFKAELEKGYQQNKQKQQVYSANPNTKEAKKYNRIMGIVGLAIGVLAIIINVITYYVNGHFLIFLLALAICCPIIGIWMIITGKSK